MLLLLKVCDFVGHFNPARKTQKLNSEISPHRAGKCAFGNCQCEMKMNLDVSFFCLFSMAFAHNTKTGPVMIFGIKCGVWDSMLLLNFNFLVSNCFGLLSFCGEIDENRDGRCFC